MMTFLKLVAFIFIASTLIGCLCCWLTLNHRPAPRLERRAR